MPRVVLRGPHGRAIIGPSREENLTGTVLQLEGRVPDVAGQGTVGPGGGVPLESAVWVDFEPASFLVAVTNRDGVPGPPLVGLVGGGVQGWIRLLQSAVAVVVRKGLGLISWGWGGKSGGGQGGEGQSGKGGDGFDLHGGFLVVGWFVDVSWFGNLSEMWMMRKRKRAKKMVFIYLPFH